MPCGRSEPGCYFVVVGVSVVVGVVVAAEVGVVGNPSIVAGVIGVVQPSAWSVVVAAGVAAGVVGVVPVCGFVVLSFMVGLSVKGTGSDDGSSRPAVGHGAEGRAWLS